MRRLYLWAGDFHSVVKRGWEQPSRHLARRGNPGSAGTDSNDKSSIPLRSGIDQQFDGGGKQECPRAGRESRGNTFEWAWN